MKILIIPTVRAPYHQQFEFSVDQKLILFLNKTFKNAQIFIYNDVKKIKIFDLIVLCGGNSLNSSYKKDLIRNKIDRSIFKIAVKNQIKLFGICHGAQFLADKLKLNLSRSKLHIGNHSSIFYFKNKKIKRKVNSFHDTIIKKNKNTNSVNCFGYAFDNSVEAFHHQKLKILGIMWHPERYKKYNDFDFELLRKFYAFNNLSSW